MPVLSVTSRGQVTLRREVLNHLGITPGEKIAVELLPHGFAQLSAVRPSRPVEQLSGLLAGKTNGVSLTVEQIEDAISQAAAEEGLGQG